MINRQYLEDEPVVAKLGTNPWWPGIVTRCSKTNEYYSDHEQLRQVFVKFLEINTESWIEVSNVIHCASKHDMEIYLSQLQMNSAHSKYLNNVPPTMVDIYNRAWNLYDHYRRSINEPTERSKQETHQTGKVVASLDIDGSDRQPCEICIKKLIGFDLEGTNERILNMNADERGQFIADLLVDKGSDRRCGNFCKWRYHARCVVSDNDLVCSCNKSVWICNICDQSISVAQLFVCNSHECMRPYHKACLARHFHLSPDIRHCPLHQCVNCQLDYLEPLLTDSRPKISLIHCVKCKLAFHNNGDCLPVLYLPITASLMVCYRHFADLHQLRSNVAAFCFRCGKHVSNDDCISCRFCLVTYHNRVPCKSSSIELSDDGTFVCHSCRFPFIRRVSSALLVASDGLTGQPSSVSDWQLALPADRQCGSIDKPVLSVRIDHEHQAGRDIVVNASRTISINLQSLDDLVCFGLYRFNDMQLALRHLASSVTNVRDRLAMDQTFRRNAFVLHFAGVFPVLDNIDLGHEPMMVQNPSSICQCRDCCTSAHCPNFSAGYECTIDNCGDATRCRNRRLQRRQYPRSRLIIEPNGDEGKISTTIVLEETVVKDVLVAEITGKIEHGTTGSDNSCSITLSKSDNNGAVIDCTKFCNEVRFMRRSRTGGAAGRPNVQLKRLNVAGFMRLGLFSCRRIPKGDHLVVDADIFLSPGGGSVPLSWQQQLDALTAKHHQPDEQITAPVDKSNIQVSSAIVDLCSGSDDPVMDTVVIDDNNIDRGINDAPLCPLCLQILVGRPMSIGGAPLVHCRQCFTVSHARCVWNINTIGDANGRCDPLRRESLLQFVCAPCRALESMN